MTPRPLALVPARGGSKRFPGKNVAPLAGRPLIAWTIEAARRSGVFPDAPVVSTDDDAIADAARKAGASVPFVRPAHLSDDKARLVDVAIHALDAFEAKGDARDAVVILQPTCPLRGANDVRAAWDRFCASGTDLLVSVTDFDHPPFWALREGPDGRVSPYFGEDVMRKTQELPRLVRPNGAIVIAKRSALDPARSFYARGAVAYPMPSLRSFDIDVPDDLRIVRALVETKEVALDA